MRHLPAGQLGSLVIYKSGKIKMRIGDILLDVSARPQQRGAARRWARIEGREQCGTPDRLPAPSYVCVLTVLFLSSPLVSLDFFLRVC